MNKKIIPIDKWFLGYFKGLVTIDEFDGFVFYYKQLNVRTCLLFELNIKGGVASLLLIPAESKTDILAFLNNYVAGCSGGKYATIVDNLNILTNRQKESFKVIESITDNDGYNHAMFTLHCMEDYLKSIIYLE